TVGDFRKQSGEINAVEWNKNVGHDAAAAIYNSSTWSFISHRIREMNAVGTGEFTALKSFVKITSIVYCVTIRFLDTTSCRSVVPRYSKSQSTVVCKFHFVLHKSFAE